jgi:murein lipoprotein
MKAIVSTLALAVLLTACSNAPQKAAEAPAPVKAAEAPAAPTISPEAKQVLDQAMADIKEAKAKFALWTTADGALKAAEEAAKAGDSATVIAKAKFASAQAKAGIAQLSYPLTEVK